VIEIESGSHYGTDARWAIENDDSQNILCYEHDATTIDVRYIKRVQQPGLFSAGFVDALMAKLATEWAEPLTSSNTLMDRMEKRFRDKTRETRSFEGQQSSPKVVRHHSWTEER
jgi:hypothetical protein